MHQLRDWSGVQTRPTYSEPWDLQEDIFLAAPSDALMLQWAHVMEKVKNAQDGQLLVVLLVSLTQLVLVNSIGRMIVHVVNFHM